jgi:hypothetical protein
VRKVILNVLGIRMGKYCNIIKKRGHNIE